MKNEISGSISNNAGKILRNIVFKCVYGIVYAASLLPMCVLYALAAFAGFIVCHVGGYRKIVVVQNIARAFPEKRYGEIRSITKKFYSCFSAYFAEIIKSISISESEMEKTVTYENTEAITGLVNSGRNVIVCLGHCGNWEMLNYLPAKLQCDVYAVYMPLRAKVFDELMKKFRSRFGIKLIADTSVVRHILLQEAGSPSVYLFLSDQCPRTKEDKYRFVFMNQETYLFSGMERLARKTNSAVIYFHITQQTQGRYHVKCIPLCTEAKLPCESEITRRYVDLLTENIREQPYGWLWSHKRWKM
jgi:KDO2-lipid IV(A) lauroyltransferase